MSTNYRLFRFLPIILDDIPGVGVCVCVLHQWGACVLLGILVQAKSAELTADLFLQPKLCCLVHHHKSEPLVKIGWLCSKWRFQMAVFKVKVSKFDCSSGRCLLNRWTVYNQTWYGDASSWAGSRSQDLIAVFWREGHSEGSKFINMMVYRCKPKRLVSDWIAVFWGEGHSEGSRLRQMFVRPIIFCTTNLLATTLGALMYHY